MSDEEHVERILQGSSAWNAWRKSDPDYVNRRINLRGANLGLTHLNNVDLSNVDLREADLGGTQLHGANLAHADLGLAHLNGAELTTANLFAADLQGAELRGADLSGADLGHAKLSNADLGDANLSNAVLIGTILANADLGGAIGLESCHHAGPSVVDFNTLQKSGPLPSLFLQGVGLPEILLEYLPSLLNRPIQYYSCFISYSTKNEDFAIRLHADLQSKGVRCWFAPHDLPIGAKILDEIDQAIRLRDKVLLILSAQSIASDWVEDEVKTAFEEERKRGHAVLFPIRLDDTIMETNEPWATKLRADRHIGDFRQWKLHDQYQKTLERVLRDLKTGKKPK